MTFNPSQGTLCIKIRGKTVAQLPKNELSEFRNYLLRDPAAPAPLKSKAENHEVIPNAIFEAYLFSSEKTMSSLLAQKTELEGKINAIDIESATLQRKILGAEQKIERTEKEISKIADRAVGFERESDEAVHLARGFEKTAEEIREKIRNTPSFRSHMDGVKAEFEKKNKEAASQLSEQPFFPKIKVPAGEVVSFFAQPIFERTENAALDAKIKKSWFSSMLPVLKSMSSSMDLHAPKRFIGLCLDDCKADSEWLEQLREGIYTADISSIPSENLLKYMQGAPDALESNLKRLNRETKELGKYIYGARPIIAKLGKAVLSGKAKPGAGASYAELKEGLPIGEDVLNLALKIKTLTGDSCRLHKMYISSIRDYFSKKTALQSAASELEESRRKLSAMESSKELKDRLLSIGLLLTETDQARGEVRAELARQETQSNPKARPAPVPALQNGKWSKTGLEVPSNDEISAQQPVKRSDGNGKFIAPRTLKTDDVFRALISLGFTRDRTTGGHAIMKDSDGRMVVVPTHYIELEVNLLYKIISQAGATQEEFFRAAKG